MTLPALLAVGALLFLAYKLGQCSALIRLRNESLDERGMQTESSRAHGAPRSSRLLAGMLDERGSSAAVVDGAGSPSGLDGLHETVGERQGRQPRSSSLYDQEGDEPQGIYLFLRGRAVDS